MTKGIPETYALQSVDQLRVIADELRQRICDALATQPMTITQLGDLLAEPPAKILYHVRELVKVDLVRLVETREKGGALEKYYRVVALQFTVPPSLLRSPSAEEHVAAAQVVVNDIAQGLMDAVTRQSRRPVTDTPRVSLRRSYRWMTDEEVRSAHDDIERLLEPYELHNASPGAQERAIVMAFYSPHQTANTSTQADAVPTPKRTVTVGQTTYDRAALESVARAGESLDLIAVGEVVFADDVNSELVDQTIFRFHLHGTLVAPEPIRALLACKE